MRAVDFVGCVLGYSLATTLIWAAHETKHPPPPSPASAASALHAPPSPRAS